MPFLFHFWVRFQSGGLEKGIIWRKRMDYNLLVDMAVMAGEIMLCSGAETYRVEDTMYHILKNAEVEKVETLVLMTGIMVTLNDKDMEAITVIKRVRSRGTNLDKIMQVNAISRRFCGGELTLSEAYDTLQKLESRVHSMMWYNLATIGVAVGFAMFFGGRMIDVAATFAVGAVLAFIMMVGKKAGINMVILDILSSAGIGFSAIVMKHLFAQVNMDILIISAIMPLVPGVAITNAIRDTLQGDYITGAGRVLEAFLKAAAIALGVGIAIALSGRMFVGRGLL